MKVKWLGHASFLITSEKGTRVIFDPYHSGGRLLYGDISETADAVTVSHEHGDHNASEMVKGNPVVLKGAVNTTVKGVAIKGIPAFHDDAQGKQRGPSTIFCATIDGMRVCHLGDLGHLLSDKDMAEIGKVDILFSPMAGTYTIDATTATELVGRIKPRVMIPMHFKTAKSPELPVTGVDVFTKGKNNVKVMDTSEIEFKKDSLPENQIIVLKPAL
ncbi:MAG: MBL fold metallo-hydrolase [Chloroflexota bacterium]